MSCKWTLRCILTVAIAIPMATPLFAQYQAYSSSSLYGTPAPQRAQSPSPLVPSRQLATAPHAYSPSEMPSVNPFANVRSRQQQMPASYHWTQTQPAIQNYDTRPTSLGDQQQHAVGSGVPYTDPAQQVTPGPLQDSFYDQPPLDYESIDGKYFEGGDICVKSLGAPVRGGWYAGVAGLIMTRDLENELWLSYDQIDIRERVLTSRAADFSYAGGVETTLGHYFNCGRNSVEISYWGIYPGRSEANAYGADTVAGLNTILHFDDLQYDAGAGGGAQDLSGTFFFSAQRHRLQRSYDAYNIELNLLGHNFTNGCGALQLGWTAGIRYLRFDEGFLYSSDIIDTTFTGAPEEVHYGIDVENNLLGFQLGGRGDYNLGEG